MKRGKGKAGQEAPVARGAGSMFSQRARELSALAMCALSLYGLLCLFTFSRGPAGGEIPFGPLVNQGGRVGFHLAYGLTFVFGLAAWLPFVFVLAYTVALLAGRRLERIVLKVLGALVFTVMGAILLAGPDGLDGTTSLSPWGGGGRLGDNLSPRIQAAFGGPGRLLLIWFGALFSLLLVTEWRFSAMLRGSGRILRRLVPARRPRPAPPAPPPPAVAPDALPKIQARAASAGRGLLGDGGVDPDVLARLSDDRDDEGDGPEAGPDPDQAATAEPRVVLPRAAPRRRAAVRRRRAAQADLPFAGEYPFPPLDLFRPPLPGGAATSAPALERNSEAIVQRLRSFGVEAQVVGVSVGPAVTQYELRLAEGIRVARLTSFEPDLAAALRAVAVRVVAPIPGKDTIGVEVPNELRQTVVMRELLEQFGRCEDLAIPLFLGKDVAGQPILEDLARMPHLLIAGTTGSGKSVCINSILLSILMTRTPAQVRMILIDPKMVELQAYGAVPHLCCDVVTNMKKAPGVLQWAVEEMETRYSLLSAAGVNHLRSYNRLGEQELRNRLQKEVEPDRVQIPFIVLVIDELADLMAVAQNEVEDSIQRLAQKSRSVGMHVILATQRPSTDVITGVIKANLPCQVAFKVNRKVDSRVILDINGAEKLLGSGDMLYVPPGGASVSRAQGTFVSDDEIQAVTRFLEDQGQRPAFLPALVQSQSSSRSGPEQQDPMYREAVEIILGQQRGSATLLQRALAIGYTRATRLLEMMEQDGLVGPFAGSKSRDVLLTLDEWRAREAAMADELAAVGAGDGETDQDAEEGEDGSDAPGDEEPA